jgi:hypothetical protein
LVSSIRFICRIFPDETLVAVDPVIKHRRKALLQWPRQPGSVAEFALAHALALGFADAAALVLISDVMTLSR